MGRLGRTWIHFPDDTEWQIGAKISEKSDYLAAEDYPDELQTDISESQAVYHCCQTAGPEAGRAGMMKIRMQVPTEFPASDNRKERTREARIDLGPWTVQEIDNLSYLNERGCSVTPRLLTWDYLLQNQEMLIPGGYIAILVMEILPGVSLDHFWEYDLEKREKIRAAFRLALTELFSHNASPADKRLPNIHYDEGNDKRYILGYEDVHIPHLGGKPVTWTDSQYFYWDLAYRSFNGEENF
ncbi:hypothetical protein AJ80_04068 [Polytolypa hystricis UAMH7299]|uniref:Aminoglycoside phosphotransferase domain-containing protein n=1 Tax=Polytolypa hystricis (strain UAMH7299) TaxID=1447883 RepID=A0A2B7YDH2_POLH7|nr:hypothetical protein AJ80_04068 [Polytolypa hystricis UAMH7299]